MEQGEYYRMFSSSKNIRLKVYYVHFTRTTRTYRLGARRFERTYKTIYYPLVYELHYNVSFDNNNTDYHKKKTTTTVQGTQCLKFLQWHWGLNTFIY